MGQNQVELLVDRRSAGRQPAVSRVFELIVERASSFVDRDWLVVDSRTGGRGPSRPWAGWRVDRWLFELGVDRASKLLLDRALKLLVARRSVALRPRAGLASSSSSVATAGRSPAAVRALSSRHKWHPRLLHVKTSASRLKLTFLVAARTAREGHVVRPEPAVWRHVRRGGENWRSSSRRVVPAAVPRGPEPAVWRHVGRDGDCWRSLWPYVAPGFVPRETSAR